MYALGATTDIKVRQMPHPKREGETLDIRAGVDTDFNAVLKKLGLQATAHS